MPFNRTQILQARVLRKIEQLEQSVNPDVIIDEFNNIQFDLCRSHFALEDYREITLESNKGTYDLQGVFFKVANFIEPMTWMNEIEIIEGISAWKKFVQDLTLQTQPMGAFIWNNYLHLYPIPSTSGETLEVYLYGLPSKVITLENEPEIGNEWDESLYLGCLSNIIGGDFILLYANAAARISNQMFKKTTSGVHQTERHLPIGAGL